MKRLTKNNFSCIHALAAASAWFCFLFLPSLAFALSLDQIKLPPQFKLSVYAEVPHARQMTLGIDGIVFVGTDKDKVYALLPSKDLTIASKVIIIANDLNRPNGVAYRNGSLYVSEIHRILKYKNIIQSINQGRPITPKIIFERLPAESWHGLRYTKFGPDGRLYISIGMPCNICLKEGSYYGTISRLNEDGSQFEIYSKGIRNSMGFDWSPDKKQLWFTDNGRDWLGENKPPDELNFAPRVGMHFGFPFYNADSPDPDYNKYQNLQQKYTPPVRLLEAHVAPLGMLFYTGKMFPQKYHNAILIAEHGSWNRIVKNGYRVTLVSQGLKALTYETLIMGWLQGQHHWGRPVDLLMMPDGAVLISDDYAGVIYRLSYEKVGLS